MLKRAAVATVFSKPSIETPITPQNGATSALRVCTANGVVSTNVTNYLYTSIVTTSPTNNIAFTISQGNPYYKPGSVNVA